MPDISALALQCYAPSGIMRTYHTKNSCLCYNITHLYTHVYVLSVYDEKLNFCYASIHLAVNIYLLFYVVHTGLCSTIVYYILLSHGVIV